nr:hypothetical protein [Tanacetum cinerariifolium]
MASGSEHDAKDALSKLLQMGLMAEYQEARFEAIANKEKATTGKEQSIKNITQTIISLRSEVASLEFKESLDVDESDVDNMEVPSKVGEFLKNKESVEKVVVGGGEARGVDEVLEGRDVFNEKSHEVFSVTPWATKGKRRVLCYVQGNRRQKKKKMEAAYQRRLWDPEIKSVFRNNTLRASEHDAKVALSKLLHIEARFEAIANKDKATVGKEQSIKKTTQTIISLQSKVASPEFKRSLDVDEDIGVDEPSSEIDSVFVIGESDVESMVVPRKFGEFLKNKESMKRLLWVVVKHMGLMSLREEFVIRVLEGRDVSDEKSREVFSVTPQATKGRRRVLCYVQGNGRRKKKKMEAAYQRRLFPSKVGEFLKNKESVEKVVVGGGEAHGVDEYDSNRVILEFMIRVLEGRDVFNEKSHEVFSVTPWATKGKRRVLCYVQGNRRRKKKKMEAAYQRRLWDPEIKSVFQNNTLRASRITEARFEAIANKDKATAGKEQSIKKTTQTIISLQSKVASPEFKRSLDVDEDIGVDEPSSEIDSVFVIGESDVESMVVPRKDMLADENMSQAVIELDDAIKHAEEISKEISPQVDGQKYARDMLADENVSQAVIELDDATKHAEEISKEISPQVDSQKYAHR